MTVRWISTCPGSLWQQKAVRCVAGEEANLQLSGLRFQEIDGFGGCFNEMGAAVLGTLDEAPRKDVLGSLFGPGDGCRFNLCRLPVGASDYALEWYSHNETDGDYDMEHFSIERDRRYLIPYIKSAIALCGDLKLFASPWSPPTWMKRPRAYNYGRIVWEERNLKAYALYLLKFVQAYRKEGIRIHQLHVQNEPTADQKFPSCVWTGEKMRDFIRDYLGPLFRQCAPDCEVWLGTINSPDYDAWAHTVLSDPQARPYVSGVGYQWAGKAAVQRTHQSWPELRLLQTENECGDGRNSWEHARYVFSLMWHYLSNGVNGYVYWNMILPPGGESTWGWKQNSLITIDPRTGTVTYNPEFYLMKHFSHFVRPGAVRMGLKGPWTGDALAFQNPDGELVVVVANPFRETRHLVLEIGGRSVSAQLEGESFNTFTASS